jgi:hypothetical protein
LGESVSTFGALVVNGLAFIHASSLHGAKIHLVVAASFILTVLLHYRSVVFVTTLGLLHPLLALGDMLAGNNFFSHQLCLFLDSNKPTFNISQPMTELALNPAGR